MRHVGDVDEHFDRAVRALKGHDRIVEIPGRFPVDCDGGLVAAIGPARKVARQDFVRQSIRITERLRRELHRDCQLGQDNLLVDAALSLHPERPDERSLDGSFFRDPAQRDLNELPGSRRPTRHRVEQHPHVEPSGVWIDPRLDRIGNVSPNQRRPPAAQHAYDLAVLLRDRAPHLPTNPKMDEDLISIHRRAELLGRNHNVGKIALALADDTEASRRQPDLPCVEVGVLQRNGGKLDREGRDYHGPALDPKSRRAFARAGQGSGRYRARS